MLFNIILPDKFCKLIFKLCVQEYHRVWVLLSCKSKLSATEFSSSFPPTPQSCFLNVMLTMMIAVLINTHYLALKCTRLFSFFLGDLHDLPWNYTHSLNSLLNVLFYLLLNGNPLQFSCLGNPMDRGPWWATVHGVTELDTTEQLRLSPSKESRASFGPIIAPHTVFLAETL